jgi:hypothetical protein
MRQATRRKEEIVLSFVLATGGRLGMHPGDVLRAMRERIPDVTEGEVRAAITWALRRSRWQGALAERKLLAQARFGATTRGDVG